MESLFYRGADLRCINTFGGDLNNLLALPHILHKELHASTANRSTNELFHAGNLKGPWTTTPGEVCRMTDSQPFINPVHLKRTQNANLSIVPMP